jgi:hypothetical protein
VTLKPLLTRLPTLSTLPKLLVNRGTSQLKNLGYKNEN